MAGPCGCASSGCACLLCDNPDSAKPYSVTGSGDTGGCWQLWIAGDIVTTLAKLPGTSRWRYTNEVGVQSTFEDGEHYSVDVLGELSGNVTVPNVVTGGAAFGAAFPLTVTITNPSLTRSMSVHTTGTGEEVLGVGAQTASVSRQVSVWCLYSVNGGAPVFPKSGGGQFAVPLRNAELRSFNGFTAPPVFVGTVVPGGSWSIAVASRNYSLTQVLNAGSVVVQGQKIVVSGRTTV